MPKTLFYMTFSSAFNGNDPGNLLRIYFFHDDENNLIVVGSLPDHLRAVKVQ